MKNSILITMTIVFLFSLTSCRLWGVRGSGVVEEEVRRVDNFSAIEISGAFEVDVEIGEEPSIKIIADDNLFQYITTDVVGNRLIIDNKKTLKPRNDIYIKVTTTELNELDASGACDITVSGVQTGKFYLYMSGASSIKMTGDVDKFVAEISGAGSIDARDFYADEVDVDISGASSASVYAKKYLLASVSGVGSVDYYGDPEDVDSDVSGVGSINRR